MIRGDQDPSSRQGQWLAAAWPFAIVLVAGVVAWWGVWNHEFVFDDNPAIVDNVALLAGDWWNAAFGPVHQPLANRPVACWSLACDFAISGQGPFGPHRSNLLLHLANGCLLVMVVRRALLAANLRGRFEPATATRIAVAIALLWIVHPLASDAVVYATQRSTLLFSGLLLVTFYATLRANGSPQALAWRTGAVVAMALGMASKEDMVVGPILVVLLERAFHLPSWSALRTRGGFCAAMAATWGVLAGCVALGPSNMTVGFATPLGTTAWQWLLTQAGVVAHYVQCMVWPCSLRGAYEWGIVNDVGSAILPGLFVVALLALVVLCWRSRPWWAFVGSLFFLLLAPTSTVLPIVTEVIAERRVYLPMLLVLVPAVFAARAMLALVDGASARLVGALALVAVAVVLGRQTQQHAAVYANEVVFWQAAFDRIDPASRTSLAAQILSNHGAMLFSAGRFDEAFPLFERAMQCEAPTSIERTHYAASLQQRGQHAAAIAQLERAIAESPMQAEAHGTLGTCCLMEWGKTAASADDARLLRAVSALQQAVALAPNRSAFWNSLGYAHSRRGDWQAAEAAYAHACRLSMERFEPFFNRAEALERLGRTGEVAAMFDVLLAARPRDVRLRLELARTAMQRGGTPTAIRHLREVLRIDPSHSQAAAALRELEARSPR